MSWKGTLGSSRITIQLFSRPIILNLCHWYSHYVKTPTNMAILVLFIFLNRILGQCQLTRHSLYWWNRGRTKWWRTWL